jgi:tetratricopeptide (TPR) repeat protein
MSDGAFPDRLTQLKSRWEADPTSRIFLQLAEEYRHQGRIKEALGVLDRGLKEHPGYLSALVAKGRCHLELGEPELARTVLERVVKQDATQMVANKLLVRAYLDTGEPERARERLDLYSLLTESDPETEELRRRLRAMEQPPQAPPTSDPFPSAAPPPRPPASPASPVNDDIFDLGLSPTPAAPPRPAVAPQPDDPFADLYTPPAPAPAPAPVPAAAAAAAPEPAEEAEPVDVLFPGLASRERRRRYHDALSSEGLFFLEPSPSWETIEEVVPAPPVAEPEWTAAEEPAPEPLAAAEWSEPWTEPAPLVVEEEPAWAPPIEPAEPVELAEEAPVFEIEERTPWSAEPEPIAPEEPAPAPVFSAPAAAPAATVTLAELYMRQGHRGEAERTYREVLRQEPDNAQAREGLAALPPPEHRPLEARDLLAGYEPGEEGGEEDLKARKAFLLNSYLQRLRQGGHADVS